MSVKPEYGYLGIHSWVAWLELFYNKFTFLFISANFKLYISNIYRYN